MGVMMGFISFHDRYYREALSRFESHSLKAAEVYEAKQLLKLLDDLADEGYTTLNSHLESEFRCLTRLRTILQNARETPFSNAGQKPAEGGYGTEEYELSSLLEQLIVKADAQRFSSDHPFLKEIREYCEFLPQAEDTAMIFLLRDTALPYLCCRKRNQENIHAWLISRRFLADLSKDVEADDRLRLPIYEALEQGCDSFKDFSEMTKPKILSALEKYPKLKQTLLELLGSVKAEKIMVVESGYCGTVPMVLHALDSRVDFRMYTTAPYLNEIYRDRIFCRRDEDIRRFETLYAQDLLLKYSSFHDGRFYVKMSNRPDVFQKSLREMKYCIASKEELYSFAHETAEGFPSEWYY